MRSFANTTLFLEKRRTLSGTELHSVKIKVSFKGERRYFATGVYMSSNDFETILHTTKRIKDSLVEAKENLYRMKSKADQIISKMESFTFHDFEIAFVGTSNIKVDDIFSCYQALLNRAQISLGTKETYKNSARSFQKYLEKNNKDYMITLPFNRVTPELINGWVKTMRDEGKSNATIGIYTRSLRAVYNYAIEKGYAKFELYPFGKKKFSPPTKNNVKKVLTKETIGILLSASLETLSPQKKARDFFILSYLWNGMNIGDMLNLKNKDLTENGIIYYRIKTINTQVTNKPIQIQFGESWKELVKELLQLYRNINYAKDEYLFDIYKKEMNDEEKRRIKKNFIRFINQHLRKLCKSLGIVYVFKVKWTFA